MLRARRSCAARMRARIRPLCVLRMWRFHVRDHRWACRPAGTLDLHLGRMRIMPASSGGGRSFTPKRCRGSPSEVVERGDVATRKKLTPTDAHKQALAEGREQSRALTAYLEALEAHRPRRGRPRTAESIQAQIS